MQNRCSSHVNAPHVGGAGGCLLFMWGLSGAVAGIQLVCLLLGELCCWCWSCVMLIQRENCCCHFGCGRNLSIRSSLVSEEYCHHWYKVLSLLLLLLPNIIVHILVGCCWSLHSSIVGLTSKQIALFHLIFVMVGANR